MPRRPPPRRSVPPPTGGLGSNSNYFLSNNCNNITALTVTILVTQDIVCQSSSGSIKGLSFQLNCYSPMNEANGWQQFIIAASGNDLVCSIQTWPPQGGPTPLSTQFNELIPISNSTLPAGYQLEIILLSGGNNITGATFTVGVPPAPGSALDGYWGDGSQHVNFIGNNGHVYELYHPAEGNWLMNDLTVLAGSHVNAMAGSKLVGYSRTGGDQHVNYIGTDGHVHELYITPNGKWVDNDLIALSKSVIGPVSGSPLDAYAGADGSQHVNFIGTDGHIRELYIPSGGQWVNSDLIQKSGGGIGPAPGSALDGYWGDDGIPGSSNGSQHVNFIGTDGHIRELYITSGGHWVNNDLTELSGNGVKPAAGSALSGYSSSTDGSQHVNFIGTDGHVHELYITPHGKWTNNDLTILSRNGVAPAPGTALDGYYGSNGDQHVNFIGLDGHVHELYIPAGGKWANNDLTVLSGNGVAPAPGSALDGYMAEDSGQHVNFIGTDGHVHELYIHPGAQWTNNDLNGFMLTKATQIIPSQPATNVSPITAFELNLVGPFNGERTTFSSGAGIFTYASPLSLSVVNALPTCTEAKFGGTAETANSIYGPMDPGPSFTLEQSFSVMAGVPRIGVTKNLSHGLIPPAPKRRKLG
jgi:hypothetical protein